MSNAKRFIDKILSASNFKQCTVTSTTSGWSLAPYEQNVWVNPTSGSAYVILPAVSEGAGITFAIHLDNSANPVYVTDKYDDAGFTDLTVSATSKIAFIEGDGRKWVTKAQS